MALTSSLQHCRRIAALLLLPSLLAYGTRAMAQEGPTGVSTPMRAATPAVQHLLQQILAHKDNRGSAFAIVDKRNASVHVFDAAGALKGSSPVLLGLARGDDSVPGIGERKMSDIKPFERTTPAGRFRVEPGVNLQGEDIVWIDYDAAVSMHRVRTANKADRRLERLATPSVLDNRISYGCINVPARFYDQFIKDSLGGPGGVVYVLPETRSADVQFRWI